ncbi:MAG: hypothetical protein F9K45_10805 [Melioribacteraceae bacterium]|nr:MAG: hypothetical protein F9K45_10805 [Melioribacteraceae bacterium]
MKIDKAFLLKRVLPIFAGASLGYAYYYFIGCTYGSCPITSNPWISTIYGGVAGFIISIPSKKKADDNATN